MDIPTPSDGDAKREVLEPRGIRVSLTEWETFGKVAAQEHRTRGGLIRQYIQRRNAEIETARTAEIEAAAA